MFKLKQAGKVREAGALMSWLSGSENVSSSEKKAAGIKGDIASKDAMAYLRGILEVVKAAGYKGLVIIIDEAETILRMRGDVRGKSLNGIRQIVDAADRYRRASVDLHGHARVLRHDDVASPVSSRSMIASGSRRRGASCRCGSRSCS